MNHLGNTVAAELDFSSGTVSGSGYHSNPSSFTVGSSSPTVAATYTVNVNGDKLLFMDSTWFVNTDVSVAMTAEANSIGSDRLSFLFRPLRSTNIVDGQFEVFHLLLGQ